jgi:hypothetical protein
VSDWQLDCLSEYLLDLVSDLMSDYLLDLMLELMWDLVSDSLWDFVLGYPSEYLLLDLMLGFQLGCPLDALSDYL